MRYQAVVFEQLPARSVELLVKKDEAINAAEAIIIAEQKFIRDNPIFFTKTQDPMVVIFRNYQLDSRHNYHVCLVMARQADLNRITRGWNT